MVDILIVGAGPAGMTAALYARRAGKSVLILEKETFGGQITYSPKVENYPGIAQMSGNDFADKLLEQVLAMGAEVEMETVTAVDKTETGFCVHTEGGTDFDCRAVILATGSRHRQLGLPNENELVGEGVSYCAVCDGAFYAGKNVAVIGGGNTALQEAVLLSETCAHVTLVQNLAVFTGEEKLLEILRARDNVSFITETVVAELKGDRSHRPRQRRRKVCLNRRRHLRCHRASSRKQTVRFHRSPDGAGLFRLRRGLPDRNRRRIRRR